MYSVKRKQSFDDRSNKETNKLQCKFDQKITSIENLSIEMFYEIFDYLNGYEIYQAFSNLNHYFQQLINSSSLLLKFKINSPSAELYKQLTLINKHKILSFNIRLTYKSSELFTSYLIDSSLDHLESLVLIEFKTTILISLLMKLTCLPRLFSLTIRTFDTWYELSEIYYLIFALPKLIYIKCSPSEVGGAISLPIATNQKSSTIEYIVIDHFCTLPELCAILSHIPQLRYCHFREVYDADPMNIDTTIQIKLFNVICISMKDCEIKFDTFEQLIREIECPLQVLHITNTYDENNYLDANRWKILILNYLPHLKEFSLTYNTDIGNKSVIQLDFERVKSFTSLFWIERKLILGIKISRYHIIYSIHPFKKRWYNINSFIDFSKCTQLTMTYVPDDEHMEFFMNSICTVLSIVKIYHLEFSKRTIISSSLMKILTVLSELDSLKITSLSISQTRYSFIDDQNFRLVSYHNKITKVYLENVKKSEEVYFLLKLCLRMKYLKVNFIYNVDYKLFFRNFLRTITINRHQYLQSLYFQGLKTDFQIINELKEMINREKLLRQFTINRVLNYIHLEWNLI
ncbi:unnamed protein product [Rotaria sordida]|uniref:F-box domain-containing protein n=1 Tax=Rotaria sordida TaxID=392033 RepID=A0A814RL55_9BILA|nr:unnamed protein product [Rotaria sordida]CAF1359954.1 unnamed protein product [Rotaria sordida]